MIDWLRRADPAFYLRETYSLRTEAQIPRYTDEAQAESRLAVLRADILLHVITVIVGIAGYITVICAFSLDPHANWLTVSLFAILTVAVTRGLPWWPLANATWIIDGIVGIALVSPLTIGRVDLFLLGGALGAGVALSLARGGLRVVLIALAIGVLLGLQMRTQVILILPLIAILAATVVQGPAIARIARLRTNVVTPLGFAVLLFACVYSFAFDAVPASVRITTEVGVLAVAYLGICIIAGRIRRAELIARPDGVLSLPQSIVPLLDRSHDHAVIAWFE